MTGRRISSEAEAAEPSAISGKLLPRDHVSALGLNALALPDSPTRELQGGGLIG